MVGIDISCDLEDKTRKLGLIGYHLSFLSLDGTRAGGYLYETVKKFFHAKVVECRTEEDGSDTASR